MVAFLRLQTILNNFLVYSKGLLNKAYSVVISEIPKVVSPLKRFAKVLNCTIENKGNYLSKLRKIN